MANTCVTMRINKVCNCRREKQSEISVMKLQPNLIVLNDLDLKFKFTSVPSLMFSSFWSNSEWKRTKTIRSKRE